MCARYWRDIKPSLTYSGELDYWIRYLQRLNVYTPNGVNSIKLLRASQFMASQEPKEDSNSPAVEVELAEAEQVIEPSPLVIKVCNFSRIDDALDFMQHRPPIPIILFFDESLSQTNIDSAGHAVLLHSYDTQVKENVYFIDPFRHRFREPYPMNLQIFNRGWSEWDNLALAIYPRGMGISLNTEGKRKYATTLIDYMEFNG